MLVNNETGIVQPLAEVAALVREHAPAAVLHTDAVQAPQWLDLGVHTAPRRPRRDLRAQVRRAEGRRRARRARRRRRSRRSSKVAVTSAACGPAPRTSPGSSRSPRRSSSPTRQRAEESARIAALRDRLQRGLEESVAGLDVTGDPTRRVAGILHAALPRRRSRDPARRARPAGHLRGVGIGVQLGGDRPVARAPRDGHGPRPRAVVRPLQPRLRVDRRRHRRSALARSECPEERATSVGEAAERRRRRAEPRTMSKVHGR